MQLGVVLEGAPELGPAGFWWAAEEDVAAFGCLFVDYTVGVGILRNQAAGVEVAFYEGPWETHNNQNLRRRIAIASLPGRVDAADRSGQAVVWSVEIDGAYFAVIFGEDAEMGTRFGGGGIADPGFCCGQVFPPNLIPRGEVHFVP